MQQLKRLPVWGTYALLAYMPFHLFLSRWLSIYTGGLGVWDAAKDILTLLLLGVSLLLAYELKLYRLHLIRLLLVQATAYGLLHLAFLLFDRNDQDLRSWAIAALYNGRLLAYFFIALVAGFVLKNLPKTTIFKLILIVSTLTGLFALAQYVLPKDLMEHFGYSIERGAKPSFFIDDKVDFPRVMSTVRDPNSYGAYLILPLSLLWSMLLKRTMRWQTALPLLGLHGLAMLLTFSRGAWIGAALAGVLTTVYTYRSALTVFLKRHYPLLAAVLIVIFTGGFLLRNTYVFKNVILHSDESTVMADPNELRVQLQNKAVEDIADDPEGHGPGTAGLASIGNPKGTFLTENYYLQLGYEVGLAGLIVFIAALVIIYKLLLQAAPSELKDVLLASFWAYAFMGLLIHLWSNEAVAAQWWLLSGLAVGGGLGTKS